MPLRRLAVTAALALGLLTATGCVTASGPAHPPPAPAATASSAGRLAPAGAAVPSAPTAWPSPTQAAGRHSLATTRPDHPKASGKQKPAAEPVRRGRAVEPAQRPAAPRFRSPRAADRPEQRRRPAAEPRRKPPLQGAPTMRQLCRQSSGVTSAELTRLCRTTYGR